VSLSSSCNQDKKKQLATVEEDPASPHQQQLTANNDNKTTSKKRAASQVRRTLQSTLREQSTQTFHIFLMISLSGQELNRSPIRGSPRLS
jgi:hypothetical protein